MAKGGKVSHEIHSVHSIFSHSFLHGIVRDLLTLNLFNSLFRCVNWPMTFYVNRFTLGDASGGLQANADIVQHLILLRSADEKDDELCKLVNHRVSLVFESCIRPSTLKIFHPFNSLPSLQQIRQMHGELILIFVARKNTCDFVANQLNRIGVSPAAMHSDRLVV